MDLGMERGFDLPAGSAKRDPRPETSDAVDCESLLLEPARDAIEVGGLRPESRGVLLDREPPVVALRRGVLHCLEKRVAVGPLSRRGFEVDRPGGDDCPYNFAA